MISCIINTFRKIDKGLKAVEDGKVLSHKEAKMRIFE
jgi:predicted transcriptional regulator